MKRTDRDLDRLLRSAAQAEVPGAQEAPYGFDTRVVALWRDGGASVNDAAELSRFLRRIGAVAVGVVLLGGFSVYRQFNEDEARFAPQANEYAIADSAIQTEFSQ